MFSFLLFLIVIIGYFIKNRSDLKKYFNLDKSNNLIYKISLKWYNQPIILLPIFIIIAIIVIYTRQNHYGNITLKIIEILNFLFFLFSLVLLDYFQRQKNGLHEIIISEDEINILEQTTKTIYINKLNRIILTGNEKQLWFESKMSNHTFHLNKLNKADKKDLLLAIKNIIASKEILTNNILKQVT